MKCLNCGQEMMNNLVQTRQKQIAYDICEACGSLWLDAGELDKMAFEVDGSIEYSSRDKTQGAGARQKDCPRCDDTKLEQVYFIGCQDIVLDRCSNCGGFWLDGGELDLINRELEDVMPIRGKGFSEFVNNVHLPYWHKRVRRKSSETDFAVEVPPIKGAELVRATEYVCPACKSNLSVYSIYKTKFEGCPKCKGVFLDKDELRKLKDAADKGSWRTLRWMDDEVDAIEKSRAMPSNRSCPKCSGDGRAMMVATCFGDSKIMLDWCPKCHGVWLDRNELQQIIDSVRQELKNLSSEEMKRQVVEEIKEIWSGPEGTISEILDAKAAISALINVTIFEHPRLAKALKTFSESIPIR